MKWTREQIQVLKKKVYGNFTDDELARKMSELNLHQEKYERSFLSFYTKHEWTEVERTADEICRMINFDPRSSTSTLQSA